MSLPPRVSYKTSGTSLASQYSENVRPIPEGRSTSQLLHDLPLDTIPKQIRTRERFMSMGRSAVDGSDFVEMRQQHVQRERTCSLTSLPTSETYLPRLKGSVISQLGKESIPAPSTVLVRGGCKSYRGSNGGKKVLDNLNMTVLRGEIYGLLGASGCGKTSLLSVLVARRQLDSGLVQVMGDRPQPGRKVGYMPQELALYTEFTIKETCVYFGRIYGMSAKEVVIQVEFLTDLLELPHGDRTVGTLSGGQQRRVSFAVALLHSPELLILDEPTVGVDPLLRQNIWRHLLTISRDQKKTIIVTTHYIEEARQANKVGMMRDGRLLAEGSPGSLMAQHSVSSLEQVFLRLCVTDSKMCESMLGHEQEKVVDSVVGTLDRILENPEEKKGKERRKPSSGCGIRGRNLWALLVKNLIKLKRNPAMLLFIFLLPAIQIVFFCLAIGQEPTGLPIGIINQEVGHNACPLNISHCTEMLGCRLFKKNTYDDTVNYVEYNNKTEGLKDVADGLIWGLLEIPDNFTQVTISRLLGLEIYEKDGLRATFDMSNHQVTIVLHQWLSKTYKNFTSQLVDDCYGSESLPPPPVIIEDPVYGDREPSFTEFMAPGIIILVIYFLAVALTGDAFIMERSSGLLDRSWVAGVNPSEILLSHILVQFCVMSVQTFVTLSTIIWGFMIPCRGPLAWLAIITMLQGLAGMSFGFLVSGLCDSQAVAMQLSIGSFYPNLLLSGILWPLEGMPNYLRYVATFLPNTLACQAMRDIMLRGWGIERPQVYFGVISSTMWIVIFLLFSWFVVRLKIRV